MELSDYERYSAPSRKGPYFFFSKNSGLQNQSVLYIQKGLDGAPEVLLDPNTWSSDGTVQLSAFAPSKDAKYAVYGMSRSGSDWQQYKVMELATKRTLDDTTRLGEGVDVAWAGRRILLQPLSRAGRGPREGLDQREPPSVLSPRSVRAGRTTRSFTRTPSIRSAFTTSTRPRTSASRSSSSPSAAKARTATRSTCAISPSPTADFTPLIPEITNDTYNVVDNVGDKLLVATNHGAPNWRSC